MENSPIAFMSGDVLACERCGTPDRTVAIVRRDRELNTITPQVVLCVLCLAQAIDDGTGWHARQMIEGWLRVRIDEESARRRRNRRGSRQPRTTSAVQEGNE